MILNMVVILHLAHFKPITDNLKNRLEIFNEYMVSVITIQMVWFTDFIDQKKIQWHYGYIINGLVGYFVYVNLNIFFYYAIKSLVLVQKRYYEWVKNYLKECVASNKLRVKVIYEFFCLNGYKK